MKFGLKAILLTVLVALAAITFITKSKPSQKLAINSVSLDGVYIDESFETVSKRLELDDFSLKKSAHSIELSGKRLDSKPNYLLFTKANGEGRFLLYRVTGNTLDLDGQKISCGDSVESLLSVLPAAHATEDSLKTQAYIYSVNGIEFEFVVSREKAEITQIAFVRTEKRSDLQKP